MLPLCSCRHCRRRSVFIFRRWDKIPEEHAVENEGLARIIALKEALIWRSAITHDGYDRFLIAFCETLVAEAHEFCVSRASLGIPEFTLTRPKQFLQFCSIEPFFGPRWHGMKSMLKRNWRWSSNLTFSCHSLSPLWMNKKTKKGTGVPLINIPPKVGGVNNLICDHNQVHLSLRFDSCRGHKNPHNSGDFSSALGRNRTYI